MAARLWRWVLGCELTWAALLAASLGAVFRLSVTEMLALALGVYLGTQQLLVSISYLLAHHDAHDLRASSLGRTLWALCAESLHFSLAQLLMCAEPYLGRHDVPVPSDARSARPVLLIHGFACNRAVWWALIPILRSAGFAPVRAMNLEPLLGGIDQHAAAVERELRSLQQQTGSARVTIIAHSMGGLVARASLSVAGPNVIAQIITIASPHHGTAVACRIRSRPTQQMCPGSPFLERLNAPLDPTAGSAFTSLYSLEDNLVAPATSAQLAGGESKPLRGLGHFALLRSASSIECVLTALQCGCRV